jgi:hypothetical protein
MYEAFARGKMVPTQQCSATSNNNRTSLKSPFLREYFLPKIVISKCIEHDHCRYDGSMIPSDFVQADERMVKNYTGSDE